MEHRLQPPPVTLAVVYQAQMALKHAQAELKTKQTEMKKMDSGYKKDQDALRAVQSSREKLQAQLDKLGYQGALDHSSRALCCAVALMLWCVCRWKGGGAVGQEKTTVQRSRQAWREIRTSGVSLPEPAL